MLVLEKVDVMLDENLILNGIDFGWQPGEAVAICGANGAGKTTLLKAIAGIVKPSSGLIRYPEEINLKQWRRLFGAVFPESFLYESLTAAENLQFYAGLYGVKDATRPEQLLESVGLSRVRDRFVGTFSKGMKQRLSIARALIHKPSYLILDEPFEGLDVKSKRLLEQMLTQLADDGIGILIVNHQIEQIWGICGRAVLLDQGRLVLESPCRPNTYQPFMEQYNGRLQEKSDVIF